jgi:hypothetical protein
LKRFVFLFVSLVLSITSAGAFAQTVKPAQRATPAASASPAASPLPAGTVVAVPAGTPVSVSFVQQVSSDSATEGTQIPVVVSKEIDINGLVIVAKGAQGQATLTKVQHSGGNGSGGKVEFNVDWVTAVDGEKIALSQVNNTTPNADRKGAASTLAIVGWATFGLLGLFSHNLAHGNAAIIQPDKVFTVFVDHTVHVTSSQAAAAPPGFAS